MKQLKRIALYAGLTIAAITFIYPFLWMASATFKPAAEAGSLALIPHDITLDNYRTMWARAPFGRALVNSTFVATPVAGGGWVFRVRAAAPEGPPHLRRPPPPPPRDDPVRRQGAEHQH